MKYSNILSIALLGMSVASTSIYAMNENKSRDESVNYEGFGSNISGAGYYNNYNYDDSIEIESFEDSLINQQDNPYMPSTRRTGNITTQEVQQGKLQPKTTNKKTKK